MSRRPPRWARAVVCAAAAAIAAVTVVGPLAGTAVAHPGGDRGSDGMQTPDHKRELSEQIPENPSTGFGVYGDRGRFLWDMPLPVDEDGWWEGWRDFDEWSRMFWLPDNDAGPNAVKVPSQPDFDGDTFPRGHHPLVNPVEYFIQVEENGDLAQQVWTAAEHFCSRGMMNDTVVIDDRVEPGAAAWAWSNMDLTRDGTAANSFYVTWRAIEPLHRDYGSIQGRLLVAALPEDGNLRSATEPATDVPSERVERMRRDRDGNYATTRDEQGWEAGATNRGNDYAADPYGRWWRYSDGLGTDDTFLATRHGRCPQPVIEWWMWYLLWHGHLELSDHGGGFAVPMEGLSGTESLELSVFAGLSRNEDDEALWPNPPAADPDAGGAISWGTDDKSCPLTWPATIGDGYDRYHDEGSSQLFHNQKIVAADRLFWSLAKEDIFAFHTLAYLVGCYDSSPLATTDGGYTGEGAREGAALDWWMEVMWQTERGLPPAGTFVVTYETDLWAGDVGPPFSQYQVRSDVGTDVREGLLLVGGLITSGLANLAARTAGDWVMAAFTLNPLQKAADGVIEDVEEWSRNLVAVGGNLWRIMIMCLIAWAAWQMARKRKVAGTFRELGLSVLLFTVLAGTAALGLDTTLNGVVSVLQAVIGGGATVLTPDQGCYVYVPHANPEEVRVRVSELVDDGKGDPSDPESQVASFWECDGEDGNGLDPAGWESVTGVVPVVAGTTCLWPVAYADGVTLGSGFVAGGAVPDADTLRLCPIRHLVKETLTIGPVWGNNLGAQQLTHSVVRPIDGYLSGWACVMWADRITFDDYASGPTLVNIRDNDLTALMVNTADAYGCDYINEATVGHAGDTGWTAAVGYVLGNRRNASGIMGHLHVFGPGRLVDTVISLVAAAVGFIIVVVATAVTLIGQFGIIVAVGFLPLVAAVAVVPGRPRQWLWRWLRFMTRMLLMIVAPAGVLLLFFHLTNLGTRIGAAVGGPPQLSRMIVVGAMIILTIVIFRTMKKNKTISTRATAITDKARERTTKLAGRDPKSTLAGRVSEAEKLPSTTLLGGVAAGTRKRAAQVGQKVAGKVTGKGTTVGAAGKAATVAGAAAAGKPGGGKPSGGTAAAGTAAAGTAGGGKVATVAAAAAKAATVAGAAAKAARPSATPPARPSATPPARPSATPPARPSATPPARPSATPPARPSATPPARPSATPPARPSATPPARPSATPPARPSATPPATPATPSARPSATPPARPPATPSATPSATPPARPPVDPAGAGAADAEVVDVGATAAEAPDTGATGGKAAAKRAAARRAAAKAAAEAWETGNVARGQEGAAKRISQAAAAARRVTKIADAATKPIDKNDPGGRLSGAVAETREAVRTWEGETFKDARQRQPAREMIAEQQKTDTAREVSVDLATAAASGANISTVADAAVSGSDAVLADGTTVGSEQIRTLMSDHPTVAEAVGERIISEVGAGHRPDALVGAAVDIASNENVDPSLRRRVATAASVETTTDESLWEVGDVEPPPTDEPASDESDEWNAAQLLGGLADPDPGKRAAYVAGASPDALSDQSVQSALLEEESAFVHSTYAAAIKEHSAQGHQVEVPDEWAKRWVPRSEAQVAANTESGWDAAVSSPNQQTRARAARSAPLEALTPLARRLDDPDTAASVMVRAMPETSDTEPIKEAKQRLREAVQATADAGKAAADAGKAEADAGKAEADDGEAAATTPTDVEGADRLARMIDWDGAFVEKYAAEAPHDPNTAEWGRVTSTLTDRNVTAARKKKIAAAVKKNTTVADSYQKWVEQAVKAPEAAPSGSDAGS